MLDTHIQGEQTSLSKNNKMNCGFFDLSTAKAWTSYSQNFPLQRNLAKAHRQEIEQMFGEWRNEGTHSRKISPHWEGVKEKIVLFIFIVKLLQWWNFWRYKQQQQHHHKESEQFSLLTSSSRRKFSATDWEQALPVRRKSLEKSNPEKWPWKLAFRTSCDVILGWQRYGTVYWAQTKGCLCWWNWRVNRLEEGNLKIWNKKNRSLNMKLDQWN